MRASGWLVFAASALMLVVTGFISWHWLQNTVFDIGVHDAGQTQINQTALLEQVHSFQLVTTHNVYDTRSDTDFHKELNLGLTSFGIPGWVAGQSLDVSAKVDVAAGVDLAGVTPQDIEVIQQGKDAVVVVRIPQAQIASAEIDPASFDISTSSGILTKITRTVGLHEKDVRDLAPGAVTNLAKDQAVKDGIIDDASREARARLQAFLEALPQGANGGHITYLVEQQDAVAH